MTGDPHPIAPGTSAGMCVIGMCGLVWVEGPDAASFLHGLVTCAVTDLTVGEGRLALLLDAKGHVSAQLQIVRDAELSYTLVTDPPAAAPLVDVLSRYHFSEDLEILGPELSSQLTLTGDTAPAHPGIAAPGWIPGTWTLVADDPASAATRLGCAQADISELELLRIRAGVARVGTDTGPTTLVQEAGFEARAVDFTKGCYLGQETVARAQHRGQVHRSIRGLVADAPLAVGAHVHFADRVVGTITSAAVDPELGAIALGILRREVPDGGAVGVGPGAVPATVRPLPLR